MVNFFDFYGIIVKLRGEWPQIHDRLRKDFSFFHVNEINKRADIDLNFYQMEIPFEKIPPRRVDRQNSKVLSFDEEKVRYNNYHGKLLSIFDFKKEQGNLYSLSVEKMHEILYLLILSRVGKILDLRGIHRIHSFGVSYKGVAVIGMMPSKGGKSTLLSGLLQNKEIKLISDDTCLIDRKGKVHPFPIRLGIDPDSSSPLDVKNPDLNIYSLRRDFFGEKKLICLDGIENKVSKRCEKVILLNCVRRNSKEGILIKVGMLKILRSLFIHCILGLGLPIILEYFWELGIIDFIKKTKIFISRCWSSLRLSIKSSRYELQLGSDHQLNKELVEELLGL